LQLNNIRALNVVVTGDGLMAPAPPLSRSNAEVPRNQPTTLRWLISLNVMADAQDVKSMDTSQDAGRRVRMVAKEDLR
jgi:hypothetical protein